MPLLPSWRVDRVVADPGGENCIGSHFTGDAGHSRSVAAVSMAFSPIAVGGGLVPGGMHDEKVAPC
eukprot:7078875-Heterocapsa_arctica.AAC.2